jgi:hypothetical protein
MANKRQRKKASTRPSTGVGGNTPSGGPPKITKEGIKNLLSSRSIKGGIGSIAVWMALDKILSAGKASADRGIQQDAMQDQAEMATPENLYYQASLPTARAEEEQARNALMTHMSGGILGPSVAKGERLIGRR